MLTHQSRDLLVLFKTWVWW